MAPEAPGATLSNDNDAELWLERKLAQLRDDNATFAYQATDLNFQRVVRVEGTPTPTFTELEARVAALKAKVAIPPTTHLAAVFTILVMDLESRIAKAKAMIRPAELRHPISGRTPGTREPATSPRNAGTRFRKIAVILSFAGRQFEFKIPLKKPRRPVEARFVSLCTKTIPALLLLSILYDVLFDAESLWGLILNPAFQVVLGLLFVYTHVILGAYELHRMMYKRARPRNTRP